MIQSIIAPSRGTHSSPPKLAGRSRRVYRVTLSPLLLLLALVCGCSRQSDLADPAAGEAAALLRAENAQLEEVIKQLRAELRTTSDNLDAMEARALGAEQVARDQPERIVQLPCSEGADPTPERAFVAVRPEPRVSPPTPRRPNLYAAHVSSRVTERNSVFWRWSWQVTVTSAEQRPVTFDVEVDFLDAEGYEVATDREYGLVIGVQGRNTYDGSALVPIATAPSVASVRATLTPR